MALTVRHFDIAALAPLWETAPEFGVSTLENVDFWIEELRVNLEIDFSVKASHHGIKEWSTLARKLAVENEDYSTV